MKILSTTNYGMFHPNPNQRKFREPKVQRLMATMQEFGYTPSLAVSVYRDKKGNLIINAGHHRLEAAKRLGIAVLYVIEAQWSIKQLSAEGSFTTEWAIEEHVINYAKDGKNADYVELLKLREVGLNIAQAASMLIGEQASSGNARRSVKGGSFKIKTRVQVDKWLLLKKEFGERVPCLTHRNFISVLSKCLFTPDFDFDHFVKKLRRNPTMLEKCNSEEQMMRLMEELYNHASPRKIPLAFLVNKNSVERHRLFGKTEAKS